MEPCPEVNPPTYSALNSSTLASTIPATARQTAPSYGCQPPATSHRSKPLGFAAGRRKSRPDRVPCGTLWPNGEFSLGYAIDETADNSGIIKRGGFGGRSDLVRKAVRNLVDNHPEALGLSLPPNPHRPANRPETYGRKGITGYGKKMVRSAAHLLQQRAGRQNLSFLTLTVPEVAQQHLEQIAREWGDVVRQLVQWLTRRLRGQGLPATIALVTECQPKRLRDGSLGCLHVHATFQGRASGKAWAVTPVEVREWWLSALSRKAGVPVFSRSCEKLHMVRKSAAGYLGKYMSKGTDGAAKLAAISGWQCVPRQWWNLSKPARDAVKRATSRGRAAGRVLDSIVQAYFAGTDSGFPGCLFCYQLDAACGPITVGYGGRLRHDLASDAREMVKALLE